jgi:O-succinylbenzoate synthase
VREAAGAGARLRVDANGSWNIDEAVARLGAMGPLELAEEPVSGLEALARLRGHDVPPIVADESVASLEDAEHAADLSACDFATVKLAKVGGPIAALAIARELPVYLSSALDGPVGIAAAAHLAQVINEDEDPGLAHGLATGRLFSATIAARECELERDMLHLPDGPGLGVVIDETALQRHRL